MPNRPGNLSTLILALELLKRIPRGHKISAPELQRQLADAGLKRELRTIQRQLEELSAHFGIERDDRSSPYGYRWKDRAQGLSLPGLTEQESLLLTLAEEHMRALLPAAVMRSMQGFFEQARVNLLPHRGAQRSRDWLKKVRVVSDTQPLLPPKINEQVFEAVSNALFADQWLELVYKNAAGKRTESKVMPLGLAQQGPRLYLVCRFDGYDNERSLALNRISSAAVSTLSFERPKDFDLQKYDADGRFGFGEGKRISLKFRIRKTAGRHLLESPLAADQKVREVGEDYEITATLVESGQLKRWLRGFGSDLTVISGLKL